LQLRCGRKIYCCKKIPRTQAEKRSSQLFVRVVEWEGAEMAGCRVGGGGGDCLIKLFGKTIPVPEVAAATAAVGEADKVGFSVHPES